MKIGLIAFILLLTTSTLSHALPDKQIQDLDARYQLNDPYTKLINDRGDGYENLYGARNFRVVLRGILYRGGANNKYNKYGRKDNQNPLPQIGIQNLCEEGFKSAYYLYETNYSSAPKQLECLDLKGQKNVFQYKQLTAFNEANTRPYLEIVYSAIKGQTPSPIYIHCWNGWHASGLLSTLALRQFCDYSPDKALQYWTQNTDGNSSGYTSVKNKIKNFKPYSDLAISNEEKKAICF